MLRRTFLTTFTLLFVSVLYSQGVYSERHVVDESHEQSECSIAVTIIDYQLSQNLHVTLKVYNLLGQEVATLVDGVQSAGYKTALLDGSTFPSGVYIYKLTAGTLSEVKKLLLTK